MPAHNWSTEKSVCMSKAKVRPIIYQINALKCVKVLIYSSKGSFMPNNLLIAKLCLKTQNLLSPGCGSESCLQHQKLKCAGEKKATIFFHQGCFSIFFLLLQVWELFIFNHFKRTSGSQTSAARVSLCSASQQSAEIKTLKTRLSEK